MPEEMTYSKAGVNIDREVLAIKNIKKWVSKTFDFRKGKVGEVLSDVGSYANVIDMGDYALAVCMDGVGSKVLVAQELKKFDTVGIDLVAMNVNDAICLGAEPIAMVDYMAFTKIDPDLARDLAAGIYEGARQAGIAVVGGETATLPEIIKGVDDRGFDLAATVIGVVKKDKIITGEKIAPGDVVLGMKSSGVHSNGFTLARKILPKTMWTMILTPTRIYVRTILNLLRDFPIKSIAHITGGGLMENIPRVLPHGCKALINSSSWQWPPIFQLLQDAGGIETNEMYRTFNCGIGMVLAVPEKELEEILIRLSGLNEEARVIGDVAKCEVGKENVEFC